MKKIPRWITLGLVASFLVACGMIGKPATWKTHGTGASICDYKVAIIYVSQFRTEEDFYRNVDDQVKWLREHGYVLVGDVEYVPGNDMTQKEIIKFAVIKYRHKEVKNE